MGSGSISSREFDNFRDDVKSNFTSLKRSMAYIRKDIREDYTKEIKSMKENHLTHLQIDVDELKVKVDSVLLKMKEHQIKLGVIVGVLTFVGSLVAQLIIKRVFG